MKKKKNISQEDISVWNEFTKNPIGIFDKEALNKNISSKLNRFKFDVSDVPAGIYLLTITTDKGFKTQRLMITR